MTRPPRLLPGPQGPRHRRARLHRQQPLPHASPTWGRRCLAVDSLLPDYGGNLFNLDGYEEKVRINIADVRGHGMEYLVRGQDVLFNLAGQVSHIDSMTDPFTDLEINCTQPARASWRRCATATPSSRSSTPARGRSTAGRSYLPVDEKHLLQSDRRERHQQDLRARCTTSSTTRCTASAPRSLRLTNTYGPRQLIRHNRQGFIGWFVRQAAFGEEIQIFGDGAQKRDFNHVDDVVDAFLRAGAMRRPRTARSSTSATAARSRCSSSRSCWSRWRAAGPTQLVPFPRGAQADRHRRLLRRHSQVRETLGWEPAHRAARAASRRRSPTTAATSEHYL